MEIFLIKVVLCDKWSVNQGYCTLFKASKNVFIIHVPKKFHQTLIKNRTKIVPNTEHKPSFLHLIIQNNDLMWSSMTFKVTHFFCTFYIFHFEPEKDFFIYKILFARLKILSNEYLSEEILK